MRHDVTKVAGVRARSRFGEHRKLRGGFAGLKQTITLGVWVRALHCVPLRRIGAVRRRGLVMGYTFMPKANERFRRRIILGLV